MLVELLFGSKLTTNNCNRWEQTKTLLDTVLEVGQFLQVIPAA